MAGSANGPVLVPGDPNGSEIIRRLRGESLPRMPLTGPPFLSDEEIDLFVSWIAGGAQAAAAQAQVPPATTTPPSAPADEVPAPAEPPRADAPAAETPPAAAGPPTYADVQPLLLQRCAVCHTSQGAMGPPPEGYRLDTYEETVSAADRARVVPFEPAASELVRKVLGQSQPRMPFGGPYLDQVDIDLIVAWVANGARDANGVPAEVPAGTRVRLQGAWGAGNTLDGLSLVVNGDTRFDDRPSLGDHVEVRGFVDASGRVVAERIRLE